MATQAVNPASDAAGDEADLAKSAPEPEAAADSAFEDFIARLHELPALFDATPDEIARLLGLTKTEVHKLLKRGVAERLLEKTAKPVRYRVAKMQPSLF